ncbi:methionyl-tRNA formyltransferase [Chitinasiproducens palmae]|uniref:Methionyl-tRNA formyltransferase n=1 Tax=Chitinasiproducens palmae TaxID=1770053 RepID=A0A1H2PT15_9BURK|nr:methionyl-tRNA formyltransferase [Chitinasiproducens palmae]SDV50236.1 methionyl-tRNA formyltransferase [Chitinasiproducens palmae]
MQQRLRVAFAGTPEFASEALKAIVQAGFDPVLVLTQPDRPAGRGMKLNASPVKRLALDSNIPVVQPRSLRLDGKYPEEARDALASLEAARCDVMVVAAYGLLLPQHILDLPRFGCLNIHASLLPRWRGAAPIHRAIEAGDPSTGISIMQMDAGLDTGAVIATETVPIDGEATTASLHDTLALLGARMIVSTLAELERDGVLAATPQPQDGVTYASKIEKGEGLLDWRLDATMLGRRVRAFDPFPGAVTHLGETPVKIWAAAPCRIETGFAPGEVVSVDAGGLIVACAAGSALRVTQAQRPGGKRMAVGDFIAGFPLAAGQRFELPEVQANRPE